MCFCIVLVRCVLSVFVDIIGKVLCCVCFCILLVRCVLCVFLYIIGKVYVVCVSAYYW